MMCKIQGSIKLSPPESELVSKNVYMEGVIGKQEKPQFSKGHKLWRRLKLKSKQQVEIPTYSASEMSTDI